MKVLGINGSARRDGNTAIMINKVFEELNAGMVVIFKMCSEKTPNSTTTTPTTA